MSQFNAMDAFIPSFTASLFKTGNVPGYPKSFGLMFSFGSFPNLFGLEENIFESVFNSTWTSKPIIVSNFIVHYPQLLEAFLYILSLARMYSQHGTQLIHQNGYQSTECLMEDLTS